MAQQNVEITQAGNKLTIVVDLTKELGESSSGKSMLVASTGGGIDLPGQAGTKINLTIYKSLKK